MKFQTQDPRTEQILETYSYHSDQEIKHLLAKASQQQQFWRQLTLEQRIDQLNLVLQNLVGFKDQLAGLISAEMGKSLAEARAECEKSQTVFPYYSKLAPDLLKPKMISSLYQRTEVAFEPLGLIFSVMPWNFPVWQVVRFAVPALISGNLVVLKHSEITAGVAALLEKVFQTSDFQLLTNIFATHEQAAKIISDERISAVTLTGSTRAGEAVASMAGAALKKTVLELGGHDPYLIFEDADLEKAAKALARSRLLNGGQSCVAAKRFIVHSSVRSEFQNLLIQEFQKVKAPSLAHPKFKIQVLAQVQKLLGLGAQMIYQGQGCPDFGAYVPPTILVKDKNTSWDEEIFGPVAVITEFESEAEALALANQSAYGLGGGVFTKDQARAERVLANLQAGFVVWNDVVKSEAALPFGGQKKSGYGRELGETGLLEFINVKTKAFGVSS